jgi:hypothetical protein
MDQASSALQGKLVNGSGSLLLDICIDRRNDICRLKIHFFISLNHRLVHDHDTGIGYSLSWLQAQVRLVAPLLEHLHQLLRSQVTIGRVRLHPGLDLRRDRH